RFHASRIRFSRIRHRFQESRIRHQVHESGTRFQESRITHQVSSQGDGMELTLRKLLHNLSALTDLSAEISSVNSFNEVIRTSLHTLLGTLAISKGAVARFSSRPRQLKVVAARGLSDAVGERITL